MASGNVVHRPSEGFVCQTCFSRNHQDVYLLTLKCYRDHKIPSDGSLSYVRWNGTKGFLQCVPRPMPRQALSHMRPLQYFNKCWSIPNCKRGHLCYYAHTDEELSLWNQELKYERSNSTVQNQQRSLFQEPSISGAYPRPPPPPNVPHNVGYYPQSPSYPEGMDFRIRPHPPYQQPLPPQRQTRNRGDMPSTANFSTRVQTELHIEDIQQPLCRENYKAKFHNLICWEEKTHIEILGEKCNGRYALEIFRAGAGPQRIKSLMQKSYHPKHCCVGIISGMDTDGIAYATQASEAAIIILDGSPIEIRSSIVPEDSSYTDDKLYIELDFQEAEKFWKLRPPMQTAVRLPEVTIEFEVKHIFFNTLVKAVDACHDELITKVVPTKESDFRPPTKSPMLVGDRVIDTLIHEDEHHKQALAKIADCQADSPPILINGPFGTGKTRLLALAAYYFLQYGKNFRKRTCILLCAHHQASVEHLLERYFGLMRDRLGSALNFKLLRLVNEKFKFRDSKYEQYCKTFSDALPELKQDQDSLIIVTTTSSSLRLRELRKGFFTHIFIDEGAQCREPEAMAALSLATKDTKIIIAGDSYQVGPSLLVLGTEARENGLKYSLLERLKMEYDKIGGRASEYSLTLNINHRCLKDILAIPIKLFYGSMWECANALPHPSARHPLIFMCSSNSLTSNTDEQEAQLLLTQAMKYVSESTWPKEWGVYDPKKICIATSTRAQLVKTRKYANKQFQGLNKARMLPTYQIQGQEFQALFWSTTEPLKDGNTTNPTKTSSDPYVFNTMLTRAMSLVVAVGNPSKLLSIEEHMVSMYGEKARCWSNFLNQCLLKDTFIVPDCVAPTPQDKERLKNELHVRVQKLLDINETAVPPRDVPPQRPKPVELESPTKFKVKQSPSIATYSGQELGRETPIPAPKSSSPQAVKKKARKRKQEQLQGAAVTEAKTTDQVQTQSSTSKPLLPNSGSQTKIPNVKRPQALSEKGAPVYQPPPPPPPIANDIEADFPSLGETSKMQLTKREHRDLVNQQTKKNRAEHTFKSASEYFNSTKLDISILKKPLTRENYREKFHHLLCWEEKEHSKILSERCNGVYSVVVYQRGGFDSDWIEESSNIQPNKYARFGYITVRADLSTGEHSDRDSEDLSYAQQASEGPCLVLDEHTVVHANHIFARLPKRVDFNAIPIALTEQQCKVLQSWDKTSKGYYNRNIEAQFKLKTSYFQGMHRNVDKLPKDVIQRILLSREDFTAKQENMCRVVHPPRYESLELDKSCQFQALRKILSSDSQFPLLVAGPFGTGKTRLLARAAYEILKNPKTKVLICAHHQASVDTFVKYFSEIKEDIATPWKIKFVRVATFNYHSDIQRRYPSLFKTVGELNRAPRSFPLVIATVGLAPHIAVGNGYFTHILIDEGAQTREPETVGPLCLAGKDTKIIIAGDHCQVGPRRLVLGDEAQSNGLGTSIMERLYRSYCESDSPESMKSHYAELLTNYRCHSGLLMLPSHLFYESTLLCRANAPAHPLSPFPLVFVCSSMKKKYSEDGLDRNEVNFLVEQVDKHVRRWPSTWGEKDLKRICIMSPSANQCARVREMLTKSYQHLRDVQVLKAYDIQGREYRAIFIGTAEITDSKGVPLNQTKSLCDRYVFNTALTRSQSLVVVVGNPYFLLDNEVQVGETYRSTDDGRTPRCWSHYLQRCFESDSFHLNEHVERSTQLREDIASLKARVNEQCSPEALSEPITVSPIQNETPIAKGDAILQSYQSMYQKMMNVQNARLILTRVDNNVIAWNVDDNASQQIPSEPSDEYVHTDNTNTYGCTLHMEHFSKGKASPLDPNRTVVTLQGFNNRKGAFDGDTVKVEVFSKSPPDKPYGKVVEIVERGGDPNFLCTVIPYNSSCFKPVNKKDPLLFNLPFLTKRLLESKDKEFLREHLQLSREVVVFEPLSVDECMDSESGVIPRIKRVIPISIARNMLFIVRFISWNFKYRYPLGAVVEALPKGNTLSKAENLLTTQYHVNFTEYEQAGLNKSIVPSHKEPVDFYAFTIDPETAILLDDAISLKCLPSTNPSIQNFELGVHIINVAKYVDRDSNIDCIIMQKGTSVYGGKLRRVMHMFPPSFQNELSLTPGHHQNVISCVAKVSVQDQSLSVVSAEVREATIKSLVQLSYQQAQEIMDGDRGQLSDGIREFEQNNHISLSKAMRLLYSIACHLKSKRLDNDSCYVYDISDLGDEQCWQTHMLIEEFMIWANSIIAEKIHLRCPDGALLRRQGLPNMKEKAAVLAEHQHIMELSHSLSHHMVDLSRTSNQPVPKEPNGFIIPTSTFKRLFEAITSGNKALVLSILTSDRDYPQLAAAKTLLQRTFSAAEYCCTENDKHVSEYRHVSLNLPRYTHFSSPLRRYFDIVVQRMLTGVLSQSYDYEPSIEDHRTLCRSLNSKSKQAKEFEKKANCVVLSSMLMDTSLVFEAFICKRDKRKIEMTFPDLELKSLHSKDRTFDLKDIGSLAGQHDGSFLFKMHMTSLDKKLGSFILDSTDCLKVIEPSPIGRVQARGSIQAGATASSPDLPPIELTIFTSRDENTLEISNRSALSLKSTIQMSISQWKECMEFVKNPSDERLKGLKEIVSTLPPSNVNDNQGAPSSPVICPVIAYRLQLSLQPHEVFKVWLTCSTSGPMISPCIQMVELGPLARVCIQHNARPADCFSDPILSKASRKMYTNLEEYTGLWEKLLLAEAATQSVKESRMTIIHDVLLKWPKLKVPTNCLDETYYVPDGNVEICLPKHFNDHCSEFFNIKVGSLICARYGTSTTASIRAVFHMVVVKIVEPSQDSEEKEVIMKFIGTSNCKVSERVKSILSDTCEVQVIELGPSHQRIYHSLLSLQQNDAKKATKPKKLACDVALGLRKPKKGTIKDSDVIKILDNDRWAKQLWAKDKGCQLNKVQLEAVTLSSKQAFHLIQGPPGTGKSETGAHLAYIFARLNKEAGTDKCVLYCGPSNKAVDVVLEKLHKLLEIPEQNEIKILRVYGKAVQRKDFPDPSKRGEYFHEISSDYSPEKWMTKYSLHHKIRELKPQILEKEEEFKQLPRKQIPSGLALSEYRLAIKEAEHEILRGRYDVILCTCNEAAGGRLAEHVSPQQCIIDECGMAIEPETIAPISLCEHVVLIGDHKQLQPVIDYRPAKDHGLSTSLFERYAEKFEGFTKTLTIQYRMHEAICEFPSNHFYHGELETDKSVKNRTKPKCRRLEKFWPHDPSGLNFPILFCDVVGGEGEHETGSKEGKRIGLGSKFNEDEARKTVEILSVLHHVQKVAQEELAVLTPYSAQEDKIKRLADKAGLSEVSVTTIIKSQGDEYGFVVLSTVRSQPIDEISNPDLVQADKLWLQENLGFVRDEHQINVGITRSKYGLIIVGNRMLLEYDLNTWKPLIAHYKERNCIASGKTFPTERDVGKLPPGVKQLLEKIAPDIEISH